MGSIFVTQDGRGAADGSKIEDAISVGALSATEWNTPLHSADGGDRVYFLGEITSRVLVAGDGGTSDTERLWIDTTAATFKVVGEVYGLSTGSKSNLMIVLGVHISTADNTVAPINIFEPIANVTVRGGAITNTHGNACVRAWCTDTDCENVLVEECVLANSGSINAVMFDRSSIAGHTGAYVNPKVKTNMITGGKIIANYNDAAQQIDVDNRRDEGWDIDGNVISDTPYNAIQLRFSRTSPTSYIRNNTLSNIGTESTITNAIQTGHNFGLIIEYNTIDGVPNGTGATGDGAGIMLDWVGETSGAYAENCIVRYNTITGCDSWENSAAISIWAALETQVYGNVCNGNSVGVSVNDAISGDLFSVVSVSASDPCVIEYSNDTGGSREVFPGDTVIIANNTGSAPDDINGTYTFTDISWISSTSFSIPVDTTGGAGSGTTIEGVNRGFDNVVYKNTLDGNTKAGVLAKWGAQSPEIYNNILSNSEYGYLHVNDKRSVFGIESYNDYYNNSVNNILDDATPTVVDATSLEVNPLFIPDSYQLSASSTLIGAGLAGVDIGAIDYVAREYGGAGGGGMTYNLLTRQLLRVSSGGSSTPSVPPAELQPVITLQPEIGLTVTAPTAFVLTVEATNAQSYQWRYVSSDGAVPNGTSATLTVDPSIEGTWGYYCVVTNVTLTAQTIDVFVTVNAA